MSSKAAFCDNERYQDTDARSPQACTGASRPTSPSMRALLNTRSQSSNAYTPTPSHHSAHCFRNRAPQERHRMLPAVLVAEFSFAAWFALDLRLLNNLLASFNTRLFVACACTSAVLHQKSAWIRFSCSHIMSNSSVFAALWYLPHCRLLAACPLS
jgi:hypothetical protein